MATQMQVCFTGLVLRILREQGMEVFLGDLSLGERCRHTADDSFFLVSTITPGHSSTKGLHSKTTDGSGADTSGGSLVIEGEVLEWLWEDTDLKSAKGMWVCKCPNLGLNYGFPT